MSTIPNWASLWEREPGLKPLDDDGFLDLAVLSGGSPLARMPGSLWERAYAALCRDAAVRWLAKQGWYLQIQNHSTGEINAFVTDGLGGVVRGPWCATFDDALFAACKTVLDERAAHAPTPAAS